MLPGPFLKRELCTSARRAGTYRDRVALAALVTVLIAACAWAWDYWGWDRASVVGARSVGLAMFGLALGLLIPPFVGGVPAVVAATIAAERDRKTLDALLTTRLSAAEIVLGSLAAGLFRFFAQVVAVVPILALIVYLGGVDVRWALLAAVGLGSTALALAAVSIAVSAGARSARRALSGALLLVGVWFFAPAVIIGVFARGWPAGTRWVMPAVLWIQDSSPFAIITHVAGLVRRASLPGALWRMIALQTPVAVLLILWAIRRLRPASRALHDGDGRASVLRSLRTRKRRRPVCWDDAVLWKELHAPRCASQAEWLANAIAQAIWVTALVIGTSWFAVPAFSELLQRGYTASSEALRVPDIHPVARLMVQKLTKYGSAAAPGQARLEFNIVLRQASALFSFIFMLVLTGAAATGIPEERERDTWTGLLATPLSGAEILRAKMLGALWRARECAAWLLAPWIVGLVTGALHPLGFVASLVHVCVSSWMFLALGTYCSLWAPGRDTATTRAVLPALALAVSGLVPVFLAGRPGSVLVAAGSPPFLTWASLLSYEDVHAALRSNGFPHLAASAAATGEGARTMLATWLLGTTAQLVAAWLFTRAAFRGFDAAVGRPCRPRRSEPRVAEPRNEREPQPSRSPEASDPGQFLGLA